MSDITSGLKDVVVEKLAELDHDLHLVTIQRLQQTVLSQAVQLSELQTENNRQAHELDGLEISLEEALAQLSKVQDTHISREDIAKFVLGSIKGGELPLPEHFAGEKNISFLCQGEDVCFSEIDGISCSVLATNTSHDPLIYRFGIIPDGPIEMGYPHFHFGYTKPTPVKRVRKPKTKPTTEKK